MQKIVTILLFSLLTFGSFATAFAQNEQLAQEYFEKGEFEKAETLYKTLFDSNSYNLHFLDRIIQCQQSQQKYDEVQKTISNYLAKNNNKNPQSFPAHLYVSKGYCYELQGLNDEAKVEFDKALLHVKTYPNNGYQTAKAFQDNQKLDYALASYQLMMDANPSANFYNQIATIYGEKGEIEKMFNTFLDMLSKQNSDLASTQRFMGRFLTEDDKGNNNVLLRKILVSRIQTEPRPEWYKMLSWLFIQQKEYNKALVQEKALFKQNSMDLNGVIDLGKIAYDDLDYSTCLDAFNFVLLQQTDIDNQIIAHYYIVESKKQMGTPNEEIASIYQQFFDQFGYGKNTLKMQTSFAHFLTFMKNQPEEAITLLQKTLENNLDAFSKAEVKLQMADIMVFTQKYNQALITYTQVQNDLKNHPLSQTARYKVAQTSYFDGDFEWANAQLKVLKKGTSKLIANDAIDLSLLIGDNIAQDSVQTALKSYAKADLLAYQNKYKEAIDTLNQVLLLHKGHPIEDEALYKQANIFEKIKDYQKAETNYLAILQLNGDDILVDDAIYKLALLYDDKLFDAKKAQNYYEKIVLEHASSIYLVPARKRYRELRGDEVLP